MKIYIAVLLLASVIFCTFCSRDKEQAIADSSKTDLLTTIASNWTLYMYVVGTDKGYHYFTGSQLQNHSLYTLSFDRRGSYNASNSQWSGTFRLLNDSTQLILEPADPNLFACALHIDNISRTQMKISSPWVEVNPQKPGASDYERFIAYQVFSYLNNHQIDVSNLKSVKLELRYFVK